MKKIFTILLAAAVLLAGLYGCQNSKVEQPTLPTVDLRYRANDSYDLPAIDPQSFTIVVKSTEVWTIRSYHPDWCMIDEEEGEAQPDSLVHVGKGESTTVHVQYYNNTGLDDRRDTIEIASAGFIAKNVVVNQKGIAYLNVPEADIEGGLMTSKDASQLQIHVNSNQNWTAKMVKEGDDKAEWMTISEGATGTNDGVVTLSFQENPGEKRYTNVGIYDRHGEERALIKITQDGVQLDPEAFEIRAGYDQLSATLSVVSNAKWTAEKGGETDWFEIDNPDGHDGNGTVTITLTANPGTSLRKSSIVLKTIPKNPGDPVAQKEIEVKQAYKINPVRKYMDNDELANWKSDKGIDPVYTQGVGTLFDSQTSDIYTRVNQGSMPFGTYTFRWSNIGASARVRHWFCYSNSAEIKVDIRPASSKISFDFNAPDGDSSQKPAISSSYSSGLDFTQPMELTIKFDPSGAEYCHITYLLNGVEMASYDTSASTMCTTKWGSKINMYLGVAADGNPGSAILEWYEYTESINWDE